MLMIVFIVFMVTRVPDPLLCLTVSTTLREKPVAVTPPLKPLIALLEDAGGLPHFSDHASSSTKTNGADHDDDQDDDTDLRLVGLEEVNLFGGLCAGRYLNIKIRAYHSF